MKTVADLSLWKYEVRIYEVTDLGLGVMKKWCFILVFLVKN